jgi:cobalt-zinc-cadmium efflux system membrane fusion protein
MLPRIWKFAGGLASQIPAIVTLVLLGALAVWGARNHWQLPASEAKDVKDEKEEASPPVKVIRPPADEPASPSTELGRLEFSSTEGLTAAGIAARPAEIRHMKHYVTANGMLDYEPYRYAQLAPRAPGTIWRMNKVMGEPVEQDEVLAVIESAEVGRAKADFLQSLAQVDIRTKTLQRLRSAGGSVPEGTLREAEESQREARIRLFNDHQRLLNYGLAVRLDEVEKLPEKEQIRYLRLLDIPEWARQNLDPETLTANLLPVRAPFKGQIVRHPRGAPGEVVATNQPLFFIGDISHLHMDLDVHLEDVADLKLGQTVTFEPEDKRGQVATGTLMHISPEVNEKTRHVQVHAEVENPDGKLRPNTFGTGRILVKEHLKAVVVPDEAVQWDIHSKGRTAFVFIRLSDTSFQARPVQPDLHADGFIEVAGVAAGEMVVTSGSHIVKSALFSDRIEKSED